MPQHEIRISKLIEHAWREHTTFINDSLHTGSLVLEKIRERCLSRSDLSTTGFPTRNADSKGASGDDRTPTEIIPRDRIDEFIDTAFASHISLIEIHINFSNRLQDKLRAFVDGRTNITGSWVADEFKAHSTEVMQYYQDHGKELLEAPRLIYRESETNAAFRSFLRVRGVYTQAKGTVPCS